MMTSAETTKSVARATLYYYSYTINTKDGTIDSNKWKEIIILFAPFAVRDCGVLGDTHANPPTADWCPRPTLPPGLLDRIVITVSRCGPYMHAGMTFMLMVHTVYAWCWPSTVPPPPSPTPMAPAAATAVLGQWTTSLGPILPLLMVLSCQGSQQHVGTQYSEGRPRAPAPPAQSPTGVEPHRHSSPGSPLPSRPPLSFTPAYEEIIPLETMFVCDLTRTRTRNAVHAERM